MVSSLLAGLMGLAGCDRANMDPVASKPPATQAPAAAVTPTAYVPPTAEQLTQLVAPIALFPDKLVAQVLAGATYPDQVTAANQWLAQNPALKDQALQDAANRQPWDVSIKSLVVFPSVLNQMASNIQWTTALGQAYADDPEDVMNAIQALRLKAQRAGNLHTSEKLRVTAVPRSLPSNDDERAFVVPPPSQTIVIEPARPDVVYVPDYNPAVVYGAPVPVYPRYVYRPASSGPDVVTTGVISFGIGVIVGSAFHHGGWHAWGVDWGAPPPVPVPVYGGPPPWHRPAVIYNNNTYVTNSTTVIQRNRITNVRSNHVVTRELPPPGRPEPSPMNGVSPNVGPGNGVSLRSSAVGVRHDGSMTMPHFNPTDMRPGQRPPPRNDANADVRAAFRPEMPRLTGSEHHAGPDRPLSERQGQDRPDVAQPNRSTERRAAHRDAQRPSAPPALTGESLRSDRQQMPARPVFTQESRQMNPARRDAEQERPAAPNRELQQRPSQSLRSKTIDRGERPVRHQDAPRPEQREPVRVMPQAHDSRPAPPSIPRESPHAAAPHAPAHEVPHRDKKEERKEGR
ncbi:DUF3300 domain-containing protein [uncultured Oxalicibacterium sp.]|uniref:DUF3300 domain-containing protein n=1 Tax=uncultured Oxalicibacterium sp. TaxID=1168540 RepID=UPI0025FE9E75|nr:DUF3300 domain-containing protein [uncultured Oxalicibacterium sp.]